MRRISLRLCLLFACYILTTTSYITCDISISPKYSLRSLSRHSVLHGLCSVSLNPKPQFNPINWVASPTQPVSQASLVPQDNLKIQRYSKDNISTIIKNITYYNTLDDIPLTGDQINITSIYINIDKVKGVYFAKDVKNIIFTLQDNSANLYYYGGAGIYKISNNTRINMKAIDRFVFQSFNNDADGILF